MECPQCGLITPEGSLRCDCGFSCETKGVDRLPVGRTIKFSSSIGSAAEALWVSFGFALLFVMAAWAYARQYRWIAQSLQLSDGTTVRFEGDPKKIWFIPITFVLLSALDRWLTGITYSHIDGEAIQMILSLVLILGLYSAETAMVLKLLRWLISDIALSSGTVLFFRRRSNCLFLVSLFK